MKLLLALVMTAHAGWWREFCTKHLIADDPYQFESTPVEWVKNRIDFLEVREKWNALTPDEEIELRIMRTELKKRSNSPGPRRP
jgi:hypothetical protein